MHGAFDVDAYAYNKPVGKQLLGQEQALPALLVGKLLQQLAQSSRALAQPQYRQLDAEDDNGDSVINKRLAELARANLYSHEFLVQTRGKKKFVQLNTLGAPVAAAGEAHKPEAPQVMAETQTQPLNVKLVLPALQEEQEEEEEQVEQQQTTVENEEVNYTEAISTMQQMEAQLTSEASGKKQQQQQQLDANADSRPGAGVKDAQNMAAIEAPNAANAAGKCKGQQQEQETQQQEQNPSHQICADDDAAVVDAKQSDRQPENDGQVNGMNVAPTEAIVEALGSPAVGAASSDKPLPAKSRRKQTQRQTKRKTKTKSKTKTQTQTTGPANEIDTKPTSASVAQRVQGMSAVGQAVSITNVKAPAKATPEISQQDIRRPVQKVKGNGMNAMGTTMDTTLGMGMGMGKRKMKHKRKGMQRRPSNGGAEQEIETTTNWWHILPYAEIRKFLNTIYDSIGDEDDDERAQRI